MVFAVTGTVMIKLAVLLTGSPRFVHEGAEWWFNRAIPKGIEIDYYGHSWSEHDYIGSKRYYNSENIIIDKEYFNCWPFKSFKITDHSLDIEIFKTYKHQDTNLSRFLLWEKRRDHILSTAIASELMFESNKIYDVVLVMRYDVIIKPNSLDKIIPYVINFYKDHSDQFHKGHDKALFWDNSPIIYTPWIQIRQGLPVMQDYMFISSYKDWSKFTGKDLYTRYYQLLNVDNHYLEPLNFVESRYHPHVFWSFIGMYSKANFITHNDLGCVALRSSKKNIKDMNYKKIVKEHDKNFDNLCLQYLDIGEIQGDL